MIFKSAISDYLNRPLRDLGRSKEWSPRKVQKKLDALSPQPIFITEPRHHQKIGFLLGITGQLFCLFDMGLGKSKIALDIIRYLLATGQITRVLILVPNVVNLEGWRHQVAEHSPDLKATYISGTKKERLEALESSRPLCFCTYAGIRSFVCVKDKGKKKQVIDKKALRTVSRLFDGIICDESTAIMNHRSTSYKVVRDLSKVYILRLGLTGTPVGRNPQALWAQMFCVDRGEALGATLGMFRQAFFKCEERYFGGVDYIFKKSRMKDLRRLMAHSSLSYATDECIDLPKKIMVESPFKLTDEQWEYYEAILEQAPKKGKMIDVSGIFTRLRQVTSGFVSIGGTPVPLDENPKLDLLKLILSSLPDNEKVVIFNEFIHSGDLLFQELSDLGMNPARLYSKTKNKAAELKRFLFEDDCKGFIINSQSGSQGLNLQTAHYVAFYESPVNPIIRQQAEKRCHRPGQDKPVFIYDLFAKNTVEKKILGFLAEGRDLMKELTRVDLRDL